MTKVVFLQNIKGVGQIGDIKEVTAGYARNFLVPKNMALLATKGALNDVATLQKKREKVLIEEQESNKLLAEKLADYNLTIEHLVNDEGTLYDSVSSAEISSLLKKDGFLVESEMIKLENPIKTIGEFDITVELEKNITVSFKLIISKGK